LHNFKVAFRSTITNIKT